MYPDHSKQQASNGQPTHPFTILEFHPNTHSLSIIIKMGGNPTRHQSTLRRTHPHLSNCSRPNPPPGPHRLLKPPHQTPPSLLTHNGHLDPAIESFFKLLDENISFRDPDDELIPSDYPSLEELKPLYKASEISGYTAEYVRTALRYTRDINIMYWTQA